MVADTNVAMVVMEQSENQVLVCQKSEAKSIKLVCVVESENVSFAQSVDPNQLVQQGGSAVAVILAIGFLINALAKYNRGFLSVIMQGKRRE
jgi:hypothetical protein